ncbi:MAG: methionine--tRNA ligase [Rickettsiales bacterium]|nr:methionine--tRNA ligase [Rickettsiales bacterium]
MFQKNFYITSPIYYVNDVPHIGHAYTSVACDVMARFKRLQGYDVRFLTGTDEHGQKVEKSALQKQKSPQQFCDEISAKFLELTKTLNLSNDDFIRTTQERHKKSAQEFWRILEKNGWIYKSVYEGWYAVRDEAFYAQDELINGKAPTGAEVSWHKEESYFFKLSAFQDKLLALYDAVPDFIQPESKRNEVISFVRGGKNYVKGALHDLSISRTSFSWGIPVPQNTNDPNPSLPLISNHVMYVWLDALTNYLSALGFPNENDPLIQKFWCDTTDSPVHIVGKDILRFHAVYWPAFLMAAQIPLPNKVFAHGWWTNSGQKISKSLGNVIDPNQEIEWLKSFGCDHNTAVDYFRYFLMREVPFGNDGDYNRKNFVARVNAELSNNIGNLAQRILSMIYKNNDAKIVNISFYDDAKELLEKAYKIKDEFVVEMDKFAFDEAIEKIVNFARACNFFVDQKAPWTLKKENRLEEMNLVLSTIAECLRCLAIALQSFIPSLAAKVLDVLNIDPKQRALDFLNSDYALKNSHQINEPKAIFPRLQEIEVTK